MQAVTTTTDLLASLGKPVDADDLVTYVLKGLDQSYQTVVDAIKARDSTIQFADLHEKLIIKEMELKATAPSPNAPATAFNAQTKPNKNWNR